MLLAKLDPLFQMSIQVLRVVSKTIGIAAILFTASACVENPAPAVKFEGTATAFTNNSFPPSLLGAYEPTGSARGPKVNSLIISKTTFTWGGCEDTTIRRIPQSENEFVFEANPNAKCGWAGWIFAINTRVPNLHITIDAYRATRDFEARKYSARYSFEKVK